MMQITPSIPKRSLLEENPPVLFASRLALREGNSKKPIYQIHKWWARRLGSVFRNLLISATRGAGSRIRAKDAFYSKQDYSGLLVLDPFVGGGTSVVEAAKCQASIIGVDIDPVACFVTRSELEICDKSELELAFQVVSKSVKDRVSSLYVSTLSDGSPCSVVYGFWVEVVRCAECKGSYEAHPHYQLRRDQKKRRQIVFCCHCGEVEELALRRRRFQCRHCRKSTEITQGTVQHGKGICPSCEHIQPLTNSKKRRKPHQVLFALQLVDLNGKIYFKKASDTDLKLYARARTLWRSRSKTDVFVPDELIPKEGRVDARPISLGYQQYRDLFNCRQLLSLSWLAEAIAGIANKSAQELLAAAFSDCLASNNMFCYYAFDYQKLTPLFGLHAYHRVIRPVENHVWGTIAGRGSFEKCYRKLLRGKEFAQSPYEYDYGRSGRPLQVHTGEKIGVEVNNAVPSNHSQQFAVVLNNSSERLSDLGTQTVDLVLSDPPYYDNLAYSELSDFFHVWLRRLGLASYAGNGQAQTPITESLFVRTTKAAVNQEHKNFQGGLSRVLKECNRVLKDDGMMVFTFHHRSEAAWNALGDALIDASFKITNVFPVRSEGQSQFHSSQGNLKWDAVCCCRKRKEEESHKPTSGSQKLVNQSARTWKARIKAGKLDFGTADELNLRRALSMMYRCNSGIHSGGHIQ